MAGRSAGSERRGHRARGSGRVERLEGIHPVLEALRASRRELHRLLVAPAAGAGSRGPLREILEAAKLARVPVETVEPRELRHVDRPGNAQHVALEAGPLPELSLEELCSEADSHCRLVMLDGVEDPQNLGAIARVAEAAGVRGLLLGRHRAPPLSAAASRASAGALEWLPVARVGNLTQALKILKKEGYWVLGADPEGSESLFEVSSRTLDGPLLVVLGAEGRGLRAGIRADVDHLVRIPLCGRVNSLNVSTAGAVVLFELQRRASEIPQG
jgi:23S rRNA (guanosine2251-2'-O)-methyltransferase